MVIKYLTCEFSDYKIAPGHGLRYAEVNGKTHMFINKKVHRLFKNGKKPLTIRWSLKWRTSHKKGKVEEAKKKVIKQKKERQVKAIVGLSLEEINKIKEKRKKYLEKVKKLKAERAPQEKILPKNQKGGKQGKNFKGK